MKNFFIVFEGIDGCGKGTLLKRMHNYLFENKKCRILTTREPTYGKYGMEVRKRLAVEEDPYSNPSVFLDLYTKDREEHLNNVILPFLNFNSGKALNIVLCDRYYHSTYAFQQTQGLSFEEIRNSQKNFLKPDITFLLDLPPEIAMKRILEERNSVEKFEKLNFMQALRENYLQLKKKLPDENIVVIDASKSKEDVFNDAVKYVEFLMD